MQQGIWDPKCPDCNSPITPEQNTEDHADPPNPYAISKYTQELMALKMGRLYNIPSTALRYSIAHGARQSIKNAYSGALRIFTAQITAGLNPSIFEDGLQQRDFISVKDIAAANVLVMESEKSNYQSFNVGGGKPYTIQNLAQLIARQLHAKPTLLPTCEYRSGDIRHAVSNISKLKKLGWQPKFSEAENIDDFVRWFKSQSLRKNILSSNRKMKQLGVLRSSS